MVMLPFFVVAALVAITNSETPRRPACRDGFTMIDNRCFLFTNESGNWMQGKEFCARQDAHLATISSQLQQSIIADKLTRNTWIGLNDLEQDLKYVWDDDTPFGEYTSWAAGEPNNYNGGGGIRDDCGAMWETYGFNWADDPCLQIKEFLCSKKPEIPSPDPIPRMLYCDDGWELFNGQQCIRVFNTRTTMSRARTACHVEKGDLALVKSKEKQNFLADRVTDLTWIGMHEWVVEGGFYWVDGTKAVYTNWLPGQPDNYGNEDCVEMNPSHGHRWNDLHCDQQRSYVCEKDANE